jgi:hypothetical protein
MRLTKAPTYADYVATFARRKKGSDTKPIFRDCQIHFANDIFTVVQTPRSWENQNAPQVLWTIDPSNIVTLYAEPKDITTRNRLTRAIGRWVYSDQAKHKTKESAVRVNKTGLYSGGTIPYHMGLQVQLTPDGEIESFINPRKDVKILVKKDAVKTVSASTARLRKLTITMARLGVFDQAVAMRLGGSYSFVPDVVIKQVSDINYQDPLGEDAEAVFYRGMESAITPPQSGFVDGQWTRIPLEERRQTYHRNVIESGMKALRKHIYEQTNSYERVEV